MEQATPTRPDVRVTETERLIMRQWEDGDVEKLWALQSRPEIMRYFDDGKPYNPQQTETWIEWHRGLWTDRGFSMWAVDFKGEGFIGWIGLTSVFDPAELAGSVEVGWCLDGAYQGRGLATEGAIRSLKIGLETLELPRVLARCDSRNRASEAVMVRAGMSLVTRGPNPNHPDREVTIYEKTATPTATADPG